MKQILMLFITILFFCIGIQAQENQLYVRVEKENLRATPNGKKIAEIFQFTKMKVLEEKNKWVKVQITGWIWQPSTQAMKLPPKITPSHLRRHYTDEEIQEAIELGKQNKSNFLPIINLYKIDEPCPGVPFMMIFTPYIRLATLSATRAKEYEILSQKDITEIITDNQLCIYISLYGNEIGFAEDIKAVIKLNDSIIKPQKSIPEKIASTSAFWPDNPAYCATNIYIFDNFDKLAKKEVKLFIIPFIEKEKEISIDLSNYK